MPIYGRGGAQEDPRGKHRATSQEHHQDSTGSVPRRPAGQRLVPADVRLSACGRANELVCQDHRLLLALTLQRGTVGQHTGNVNMQPGLGIIPMLLGLNNSSGSQCMTAWSCHEVVQHTAFWRASILFCVCAGNAGYAEPLTPEQQHQVTRSNSHENDIL